MDIRVDPKLELDEDSARALDAEIDGEGYLVSAPDHPARPDALPPSLAVRGVQAVARVLTALGNLWIAFFRELARVFVGAGQSLERSAGHGDPVVDIISLLLMYLLFMLVIACTAMTWVPPLLRWGLIAILWVIGALVVVLRIAARGLLWLLGTVVFPGVRLMGRVLLHVPLLGSYLQALRHGRPATRVAAVTLLVLVGGVWFLSASAPTWLGPGVHDSWEDTRVSVRKRLEWDRVENTFHRVVREVNGWMESKGCGWEAMTASPPPEGVAIGLLRRGAGFPACGKDKGISWAAGSRSDPVCDILPWETAGKVPGIEGVRRGRLVFAGRNIAELRGRDALAPSNKTTNAAVSRRRDGYSPNQRRYDHEMARFAQAAARKKGDHRVGTATPGGRGTAN